MLMVDQVFLDVVCNDANRSRCLSCKDPQFNLDCFCDSVSWCTFKAHI